MECWNIRG